MATNWYDPNSSSAGFYNSPQDFLFKSGGGTWYGQGAAGQDDAGKMPTMGDYYFGGAAPLTQEQIFNQSHQANFGNDPRFNPAPSAAPTPSRAGGGSFINLGNNVSVPQGPLWQRYQAVQANPEMITADPAYQFLQQQGEQALGRSAGAKRKRFAGQTMLDFQKQGQGQAAAYLQNLLPELRAGAGQEWNFNANEARAQAQKTSEMALMSDPYGHGRQIASQYRTADEAVAAALARLSGASPSARANTANAVRAQWEAGRKLLG